MGDRLCWQVGSFFFFVSQPPWSASRMEGLWGCVVWLWDARDRLDLGRGAPRVFTWDLWGLWVTVAGSPWDSEALVWACWHLRSAQVLVLMGHGGRRTGLSRCPAFWRGPARPPAGITLQKALPSASKMDSHSGSSAFPVIIPHALQPCLLLTELPSCGLAGGGSGGVRQSPRLPPPQSPPPSPPQAPQVAGRPPAPQAQAALCLAWGRGAAPGPRSFLASAKPSRLSAHCAHCLRCSTPAVLTWSRLPGLPQPRCQCLREGEGLSGGPCHHDSGGVGGG